MPSIQPSRALAKKTDRQAHLPLTSTRSLNVSIATTHGLGDSSSALTSESTATKGEEIPVSIARTPRAMICARLVLKSARHKLPSGATKAAVRVANQISGQSKAGPTPIGVGHSATSTGSLRFERSVTVDPRAHNQCWVPLEPVTPMIAPELSD